MQKTNDVAGDALVVVTCMRCQEPVELLPAVLEGIARLNAELARRSQLPISGGKTAICAACRRWMDQQMATKAALTRDSEQLWLDRWKVGEIALEDLPPEVRVRRWFEIAAVEEARARARGAVYAAAAAAAAQGREPGEED